MSHNIKTRIIFISLLGLIISPIIDFINSFEYKNQYSLSAFVEISNESLLEVTAIHITFILTALFSIKIFNNIINKNYCSNKFYWVRYSIFDYLYVVFYALSIYKSIDILNFGFDNAMQLSRSSEKNLGVVMYSIMIFSPFIISYRLLCKKYNIQLLFFIIIVLLINISSGFRLLILWLILILYFTLNVNKKLITKKNVITLFLVIILFIIFQQYRLLLEGGDNINFSLFDQLNRTYPIEVIELYNTNKIDYPKEIILETLINPFAIVIESIGIYQKGELFTNYYIEIMAESLFREYLVWRGTPTAVASGFSIGIVEFSYILGGIFGLIFTAIIFGFCILVGYYLIIQESFFSIFFGASILAALIFMSESAIEAIKIFIYSFIFLALIYLIRNFKFNSNTRTHE